ncbi:MAG: (2Fe-2S)-binding protein [Thermomicrobiales bacterium]
MHQEFPAGHGAGRIQRHELLGELPVAGQVTVFLDGAPIRGRAGEPLLATLLAAGVRVMRTMPELGDPRGGYCLVGRCADCQMVVDGVPGSRACVTTVREGMQVQTQHGLGEENWESLEEAL